jgi:hypothetical protein
MQPHSLQTLTLEPPKSPPNVLERRFGKYVKGAVLPEAQIPCSPRRKVSDFPAGFIPASLYERNLEQNQKLAPCCRHPENHEIEGRKSHPDEKAVDIYIFHCDGCGRKHRVFCVGMGDPRPEWK